MLELILLVALVYLVFAQRGLKSRLDMLERDLRNLRDGERGLPETRETGLSEEPELPGLVTGEEETAAPGPAETIAAAAPAEGPWKTAAASTDAIKKTKPPEPPKRPEKVVQEPPSAFVFRQDTAERLSKWLRENWVLAVAAMSLTLAGVFLVQYGVEHGLITPFWRVMLALFFGAALIAGGEAIRRAHGDFGGSTRFLPSTLSGAGLIVLFVAVLAARVLYDLIGPGPTLAGLCAVSALAVVFGWFYGPVLAAIGIIGATSAPFLVGGQSDTPWIFYYYFALIALAGLAVDTVRRWAWVSAISLIATFAGMVLLYLDVGDMLHFLLAILIVTFGAITIPERALIPRHPGAPFLGARLGEDLKLPEFPVRVAFGAFAYATLATWLSATDAATPDEVWLGLAVLTLLLLAASLWMARAPGLVDHALLPAVALLALVAGEAMQRGPLYKLFLTALVSDPAVTPRETGWIIYTLAALGAVGSLSAFRRLTLERPTEGPLATAWALGAAVFAPTMVLIIEFFWAPAKITGSYPWALTVIAVAALMALLAERAARRETSSRLLYAALFTVAALTLIALSLFLILSKTALTLALSVMIVLTVLLDRRFSLPLLSSFIQLGMAVIAYRLVVDPGLFWAIEQAPAWEVPLAYLGPVALVAGAWALTDTTRRGPTKVVLESGIWTLAAVFVAVQLARLIDDRDYDSHWALGLFASLWIASAMVQVYRLRADLPLQALRWMLAGVFGLLGVGFVMVQAGAANSVTESGQVVLGPLVFDTLAVAFLSVAAVFALGAWKLDHLDAAMRQVLAGASGLYGAVYLGLEIRRFWRGDNLSVPGVTDPELYTYTVAMLVVSLVLLFVAFSRRSVSLRTLAMAGVGLTIAKVFLIDMAGLAGLLRVFSFMGLGLSLVALAWLNRKMAVQWDRKEPGGDTAPDQDTKTEETPG